MNLSAIDLNLLTVFEALIAEHSVSRAASRVGVSQPALSNALARLRALFGDELFVRMPQEMQPTPRALELAEPICEALRALRAALDVSKASFDPATSTRIFTIAASDNCDFGLAPAFAALHRRAPHIRIDVVAAKRGAALDRLDEGSVDLALGRLTRMPERFFAAALYDERSVCICDRRINPLPQGLTLAAFAALPHIHVDHDTTEFVDLQLAAAGLARHNAAIVPNFALVPYALEGTDLVAVTGARIAERFAALSWIGVHPLPLDQESWTISAVWGKAQDGDRGVAWLREQLQAASAVL